MRHTDFLDITPRSNGLATVRVVDGDRDLAEVDRVVFVCQHGSHLYGTAGPSSDLDVKAVYMSDLADIILGRDEETIQASTGGEASRNEPGDFDIEFVELRKFIVDALDGQTYAVELLHCPESHTISTSPVFERVRSERDTLISKHVEPFVGYCLTQARRYGEKGRRLALVEQVLAILEAAPPSSPLEEHVGELPMESEFISLIDQPIRGQDEPVTLVEIVGKKFELTARVKKALRSLRRLRDKYGPRAHRAKGGVDWKAVSHAYRVAFELRELLTTGQITFPLEEADFLTRVKRGDYDYETVEEELPALIEEATQAESALREEPDRAFWEEWLVGLYTS